MNEFDVEKYREACDALHASKRTVMEVMEMTNETKTSRHFGKRVIVVAAVVVLALALAVAASAYAGLWDWIISPDRDEDTRQRGTIAEAAAEKETGMELEMGDTALDLDEGISYFFYSEELERKYQRGEVQVDENGRVVALDLRMLYPYPRPEDCPEEYIAHMHTEPEGGEEVDMFLADVYLPTVAYPDRDAYNASVQEAARYALDYLHQEGYIEATSEDVDLIYFDMFNGGAACVDVLVQNGDVYILYLTPDELIPIGFRLSTAEAIAGNANSRFPALFDAVRNGTLDEYNAAQRALFANGVG